MVNKVIVVGNLGNDPELKTVGGNTVCNMSVAATEKWKDKDGNNKEHTEWFRVNVWGKMAENCAKYLSKGKKVYVEGKQRTRSWEDKDGQKRYATELVAENISFLSPAGNGGGGAPASGGTSEPHFDSQEEIPF